MGSRVKFIEPYFRASSHPIAKILQFNGFQMVSVHNVGFLKTWNFIGQNGKQDQCLSNFTTTGRTVAEIIQVTFFKMAAVGRLECLKVANFTFRYHLEGQSASLCQSSW